LIGYGNDAISSIIPDFPIWLLPLLSAFVAVALGVFIWKKIKEVDLLKYEFVNVVTHRFRTPLTYSRWALETLRTATDPHDREEAISTIDDANTKLNELTNTLISISNSDDVQYAYTYTSESFLPILNETLAAVHGRVEEKALHIELPYGSSEENTPLLSVDRNRIQFALQMIIENAIIYSPEKSKIVLNTTISKNFLIFSAQDFGIGISKEDIGHLFSKFFRGATARKAYTEGLGIGLYVARDIMHRHGGDLWAESAGLGKGSTFFIKIPISRK
jgi:two-component system sensor histidine kinase VicK